jgi:TetR/AcrR family transcriptional regulator, fatty acid metabolism regulator protein
MTPPSVAAPIGRLCWATLAERSTERRSELLRAAVRVFARRGFRASRVADIAEEAGVAHGLLYHYFRSKDEVLDEIFHRTWSNLAEALREIEASGAPLREQLQRFAAVYLGSWLETPDLIRVLVREIARGPDVGMRADEIQAVLGSVTRLIDAAKRRREVRPDVDARFAAVAIYGALEEILTGFVLDQLPSDARDVERAVAGVVDVVAAGLAA